MSATIGYYNYKTKIVLDKFKNKFIEFYKSYAKIEYF